MLTKVNFVLNELVLFLEIVFRTLLVFLDTTLYLFAEYGKSFGVNVMVLSSKSYELVFIENDEQRQ